MFDTTSLEWQILDSIGIPIFIKNNVGKYIYCNTEFSQTLRMSKEKILGKSAHDISTNTLANIYHAADRELFESGTTQTYISAIKTPTEQKIVQFDKKILITNKVPNIVGTVREKSSEHLPTFSKLSDREKEVIVCLIRGFSTKEIAKIINISPFTVNDHLKVIYRKLDVHSKTQAFQKIIGTTALNFI